MTQSPRSPSASRRAVLASLAVGGATATSGCVRRIRAITGWQSTGPLSLRIKTTPADADPYALRIARRLAEWYRGAGIDAQVTPMAEQELLRQVLLNHDFDVFVARFPVGFSEPDVLYSLLHSRYATGLGWQNPFGYANLDADDSLDRQRRTGDGQRRAALASLQRTVADTQPFTVVAFPDTIRAARSERFRGWRLVDLDSPLGYLALTRSRGQGATDEDSRSDDEAATLRVATTDRRATANLNPLAVEFRRTDFLIGLLYDSLGRARDGRRIEPWLARSWAFTESGPNPTARVRLRSDLTWHDGEPLTADDVAFTYAFIEDTSLEDGEGDDEADPVPAPRYQGRSDLVAGVEVIDDRSLAIQFAECDPRVAIRAFTVPVLPEHVWSERTGGASIGGIEVGSATEALVASNIPPVGSGPLSFVRNTAREELVLERFEDHFLTDGDLTSFPARLTGGPAFDRMRVRVTGSDVSAVGMVLDDDADVTATAVGASTVPRIGRSGATDLLVDRSDRPYVVGYNVRRSSLGNPRFRSALAALLDKTYLVGDVFDGYAVPAASPLAGTDWLPSDLEWTGSDPATPFLGTDGELATERVRDVFRNAGYRYEDGRLVEG